MSEWNVEEEEQLHEMARRYALQAAREGYRQSGRGAAVVPWPPEGRLTVSFLPEVACAPLGDEILQRVGAYNPFFEFVMVYLFEDGTTDAYTYRMPDSTSSWLPPTIH